MAAVNELVKASKVEPASLVVEVRTRDLINAFVRQIESRGMDPVAYLRALGITGEQLEARFREEAVQSIATEIVLEGVADKLGIEVSDDDIRSDLHDDGESDEDIERVHRGGRRRPCPRRPEAEAGRRPHRRRGDADLSGAGNGA